jgi:hypothetical protein
MNRYQYREIGEGEDWRDCSEEAYEAYGRDPVMDTRIASEAIDYMRRCDIQRMTDTERLIANAMAAVEKMPGDVRLTDAVSLLFAARTRLADYVDQTPGNRAFPSQEHTPREIVECLGFFASCIRSGESWTTTCDDMLAKAQAAMKPFG